MRLRFRRRKREQQPKAVQMVPCYSAHFLGFNPRSVWRVLVLKTLLDLAATLTGWKCAPWVDKMRVYSGHWTLPEIHEYEQTHSTDSHGHAG